jgi:hypothetical protein
VTCGIVSERRLDLARQIVLNFNGEVSQLGFTRVTREKLYGKKARIVVDETEEVCSSASLTVDGELLLPTGGTASMYVNESFNVVDRKELVAIDGDGNLIDPLPSTLNVEQPLTGPVSEEAFLDHAFVSVYEIASDEIGEELRTALEGGAIFESRFNYNKSLQDNPVFFLQNDQGIFGLVAEPLFFDFVQPDELPPEEPEGDDPFADDDDLDFGMF